uniref:GRIP domain-containing protein n=1 Tax=Ditylenchus dipsaci TaxID=166011 RepID=A0A915CUS5_9BILA
MLTKWGVSEDKCHVFLRDEGANMRKAFETEGFRHADCGAHKLNLVVNKAIFEEKDVSAILKRCRALIGHFKHSLLARDRLRDLQTALNLPEHSLKQVKVLKEEIRRLERNEERETHIENSGEYFKNIMLKFLAPEKVCDERQQLLPVLQTMLRLSAEEFRQVEKCIGTNCTPVPGQQGGNTGDGGDWKGLLGSLGSIF